MLDTYRRNNKRRARTSLEKYVPLTLFVTFACERELEIEQNCNIYWPPLLWPSALFSRAAQPEAQGPSSLLDDGFLYCILSPTSLRNYWGPRGPLRPGVAFPTTSYQQLLWSPTHHGLQGPPPPCFLYHILSATSLDPNSIDGPEGPIGRVWLSLPHLVSNSNWSDFLSWPSYIIVQRPLNRPLNLWNGMFDRHQAEITVMQFRGHSLQVYQSTSVSWDFLPCPISSAKHAYAISSHNCHWNVSLPSDASP